MKQQETMILGPTINRIDGPCWEILYQAAGESSGSGSRQEPEERPGLQSPRDAKLALGPILIVDDDRAIREVVAETLELEGYLVEQAAHGAEALEKIVRRSPALVLLDMRMPVLDGWGVARALRHRGLNLPIVVMTAAQNARAWANEIGAVAYLAKPFEDTQLLDTVERYRRKPPESPG